MRDPGNEVGTTGEIASHYTQGREGIVELKMRVNPFTSKSAKLKTELKILNFNL